jgi:DNA-binding response OmpR family regulator/putative methionine-R-sulfoxide reductase with GAF domain
MPRERILIIDDSARIAEFLTDVLEPLGYTLLAAAKGKDGLAGALSGQPDLIMLDLNLPDMSGLQVLESLRQRNCQSPVIMMTSYGSESVVVQALRLGVRDYLTKPFAMDELLAAVERALEEGRLRRDREHLIQKLSRTNQEVTLRMRELATLQGIGRSVASLMPKQQLLRRILDAAIYLAGANVGALFLLDGDSHKLRLEAVRQGQMYRVGLQVAINDSHVEEVLRSGRPMWISGPTKSTGVTTYLGQKAHSLLYVPVKLGDAAIGALGVAWLHGDRVSPEIENRLVALADYAAIALQNAQLYEESQLQAQQLSTVNHIARTTVSSLDLGRTVQAVVRSLKESLHVEAATLVLLNEESGELVFEILVRDEVEESRRLRAKVGQGIVGWVIQNKQSLRVNDVSQEPRCYPDLDRPHGYYAHSILCAPLTVSSKVIGAIEAVNKLDDQMPNGRGQFTDRDEELLRGAAAFVAMAIENARLHAAMQHTVAAQTVHDTVVTLSHHVNNPLQVLWGVVDLLKTDLNDTNGEPLGATRDKRSQAESTIAQVIDVLERELQEISVAISVLQDISSPESILYLGSIQMLDIEREFRARLESVASQSQSQIG